MFPTRFFADRMFAPRYFCKVGATAGPVTWFNGLTMQRTLTGAGA